MGVVTSAALVVTPGHAQPREPNEVAARFDSMAKQAYRAGSYEDALAGFEAAYRADPLPRFLYNQGRAHEKRGNPAAAIDYYEWYLVASPEAEDRANLVAFIEMARIKLTKSHGLLKVTTEPPGSLVVLEVSGKSVSRVSPWSRWVIAGAWQLTVAKDGFQTHRREVVVVPGQTFAVSVTLNPLSAVPPPAPPAPPQYAQAPAATPPPATPGRPADPPPAAMNPVPSAQPMAAMAAPPPSPPPAKAAVPASATEPEESQGPWYPWAIAAVGGGLLVGGGFMGWQASESVDDRDKLVRTSGQSDVSFGEFEEQDETARDKAILANVLIVSGALAAAVGLYLGLQPSAAEPAVARPGPELRVVPGGLVVTNSFQ